ncbi:hypothetical protein FJY63_05730, partial [Candidatus Sumerlaeota bacterium]|nr:hypothetical protein [Candidatus Sumerlaeota bacterium]
ICGSGGDETYKARFVAWGQRLKDTLAKQLGRPAQHVVLLMESADGATSTARICNLETIRSVLKETATATGQDDDLFIYLIGHGSHWQGVSRFHIPGPDLTADELAKLLEPMRVRRLVVVNAASCSAGFINALAKAGRVICTATKSVDERNATEFIEYFIQALEDGSADQNRDERISVLEACRQAAALTEAGYVGQGLIATEHALIDDNGDALGTRLVQESRGETPSEKSTTDTIASLDGTVAEKCFLKDFSFPPTVPRDLVSRYLSLLDRIEELKRKKTQTETGSYYAALETLLVEAAQAHREIRQFAAR